MLNYLWAGMLLVGILYGALTGRMAEITNAALDSSKEAVTLCISMMGIMSFWVGIMEIASRSGLLGNAERWIQPFVHFLFPEIPEGHKANEHITTNLIANFLGLGWAATPAGLRAMEELAKLEDERRRAEGYADAGRRGRQMSDAKGGGRYPAGRQMSDIKGGGRYPAGRKLPDAKGRRAVSPGTASNEMCTFLILNISSLQLIPMNIIAYRSQYGSPNPTAVVGPGIVATAVSTAAAVVFCKVMEKKRRV